jgi:membrane-bound lytic murein transglycosylase D
MCAVGGLSDPRAQAGAAGWAVVAPKSLEGGDRGGALAALTTERFDRTAEFGVGHPRIDAFVNGFKTWRHHWFQEALERSGRYRLRMVAILKREGLPAELAYLPLIESGYHPGALSPAGAVGPWQFTRRTGRGYGLRIDQYVDERRDPIQSTHAAARYLRDLHDAFGSWHLALAAYNVGPGRIARALEKCGARTFWDIGSALPRETLDYVPRFLAAVYIARAPAAHGFTEPDHTPLRYELVHVSGRVSLATLAQIADVSAAELADLNPALIRNMTPPDRGGYRVRVPKGAKEHFIVASEAHRRAAPHSAGGAPARL